MSATPPHEPDGDIIEIIDQRRSSGAHGLKYVAFAVVGVAVVIGAYGILVRFTPREIGSAVTTSLEKGVTLTGRFLDYAGRFLTTANSSSRTEIEVGRVTAADKTGPLIVARQDLSLKFTNVDERIFGTSTTEVRAAAKAYYYVPLLGPGATWKIDTLEKDGVRVCVVHAPALRVLTPINLDTRSIEIKTSTGALRSNGGEMTEAAYADITPRLNREAIAQADAVRGAARKTIAAFVKNWLLTSGSWGGRQMNAIQVLFPGETPVDTDFVIPGFYDRS